MFHFDSTPVLYFGMNLGQRSKLQKEYSTQRHEVNSKITKIKKIFIFDLLSDLLESSCLKYLVPKNKDLTCNIIEPALNNIYTHIILKLGNFQINFIDI